MRDLAIALDDRPGALAELGAALGSAGVSVEGGGAFVIDGVGIAHFLFKDATTARDALERAGIRVLTEREVLVQRLRQEVPGQLGEFSHLMAEAGVNIDVMYSDHANQLILAVDEIERERALSKARTRRTDHAADRHRKGSSNGTTGGFEGP
jgi:hypothetical protein